MLAVLAVIYVISLGLALLLVPLGKFTEQDSPFITSLKGFHLDIILDIFNGIFIIAGFSTLVASLFAVTTLLCTMADDGDAPKCFRLKENKKNLLACARIDVCRTHRLHHPVIGAAEKYI